MSRSLRKGLFIVLSFFLLTLIACDKSIVSENNEEEIKAEVTQELPKLLDFGATKCAVCKRMAPILDELTEEYEGVFDVEFVDVWQPENKERAQAHGVQSIPVQIFYDADGKELWRHVGFFSKEDILSKWDELGFNFETIPPKQSAD